MDRALINHIYQPIVDWSQKRPVWWVRRSLEASCLLLALLQVVGDGRSPWVTVFAILGSVMMWRTVDSDFLAAVIGAIRWLRVLYLSLFLFRAAFLALAAFAGDEGSPVAALDQIAIFVGMSAFYFAACRPPAPRPPKHRTRLAGAHS